LGDDLKKIGRGFGNTKQNIQGKKKRKYFLSSTSRKKNKLEGEDLKKIWKCTARNWKSKEKLCYQKNV
jgi:hypothetical protein